MINMLRKRPAVQTRLRPRIATIPQLTHEQRLLSHLRNALGCKAGTNIPEREIAAAFLSRLEWLGGATNVRKFEFEGIPVAIKDTRGEAQHGLEYKKIRQTILAHQLAVRNKTIKATKYQIRSPHILGKIENFLIMQFVHAKKISEMEKAPPQEKKSFEEALEQATGNFETLYQQGHAKKKLQGRHMMISNTNPSNPIHGKWIFYFPYDQ
ncbi:MAG: hypothetical protein V1777_01060 [Candidatus Micrarchaeota archaeon]